MKLRIEDFEHVRKFGFKAGDKGTDDVRKRELSWLAESLSEDSIHLEFGVFKGTTINHIASLRPHLTFHGFDSFEGLPEDWDLGGKYVKADKFHMHGELPTVPSNVRLHKGWFTDTVPKFKTNWFKGPPIGYLHLDADLYSSTAYVLEELRLNIVPGTIIRFDELCCWRSVFGEASPSGNASRTEYSTWRDHEWKALTEWMEKYSRRVIPICRNWFQGGTVIVTQ